MSLELGTRRGFQMFESDQLPEATEVMVEGAALANTPRNMVTR